ncbi:MAG TPA: galactose/methyl galactoside ABC transporter permease MglC [Anaerolineaceae bacterium]|nr:galactose/methyl galactoside ABC transporter permease MglC [Anaerolineaceae bacterium]HPN52415.1 galactose/methyl galactoside ABC transporter permease MglC [Anaerolineaceae bacterium]
MNFNSKAIRKFAMENAIYIVLVLLIIVIAFQNPAFLSLNNFRNILIMSATRIIIALGVGGILITQGTDLSAGRMVGLAAVVSASMMQTVEYSRRFFPNLPQLPVIVPILICIVLGIIIGFANGLIVSKLNVPPFIATLGTMVIIYGMNSIYFALEPNSSQPIGGLRTDFTNLGTGYIGPSGDYSIPYIVIIALLVALVVWVLYNKTTIGKYMYAIGGNPQAARVSGINVTRVLILVYSFAGALYGLAGVLEAARTGGATNNYGNMYELDAIAACVVGGVSTSGGIGTVPGIVVGVLIFGVINYGLTFIGVNPYWQQIVKGLIIVFAVAFDIAKYYTKK